MFVNFSGVVLAFITTLFILPMVINMLLKVEFVRPNYKKENIPLGVGLVFVLCSVLSLTLLSSVIFILVHFNILQTDYLMTVNNKILYIFPFAACIMTMLGFLDDVFGSREASGLKGHFIKLVKEKELTTGGLKAVIGGLLGLLISISTFRYDGNNYTYLIIFVDSLIIALSTNAINLLDLRPGRAGKGYIFILLLIILLSGTKNSNINWNADSLLFPLILFGSLLAYLPMDLKAKGMMGDTGSNVLGITLGITAVLILPIVDQIIYAVFLIAFHIFTEKYSLSKVIDNNKVLKYLDQLGRDNN